MTLEGAINFHDTELYTIYTMNSSTAGQYCVVLPKNNNGMYNMLVDLHMKSLFDSVNAGSKSKDELINDISICVQILNDRLINLNIKEVLEQINVVSRLIKEKVYPEKI